MFVENVYLTTQVYKKHLHFVHRKLTNEKRTRWKRNKEERGRRSRRHGERGRTRARPRSTPHTLTHGHTLFSETFIWIPFSVKHWKVSQQPHKWCLWLYEKKNMKKAVCIKCFHRILVFMTPSHTVTDTWTSDSQLLALGFTWYKALLLFKPIQLPPSTFFFSFWTCITDKKVLWYYNIKWEKGCLLQCQ